MTRLPMIPQEWLEADLVGLVANINYIRPLWNTRDSLAYRQR